MEESKLQDESAATTEFDLEDLDIPTFLRKRN